MANNRRRRNRRRSSGGIASVISSIALLIIAILMVVFLVLYIRNSFSLTDIFGSKETADESAQSQQGEDQDPQQSSADADERTVPAETRYGLVKLDGGSIVYCMDRSEASKYDDDNVITAEKAAELMAGDNGTGTNADSQGSNSAPQGNKSSGTGVSGQQGSSSGHSSSGSDVSESNRYYLINSWLDHSGSLYYFTSTGEACTDQFKERAFIYDFDNEGRLSGIKYDRSYKGNPEEIREDYPGLITTKALWAFISETSSIAGYNAIMYKRTTDSLSHNLGTASAMQYTSPYAYEIFGNDIFYLAVPDGQTAGGSASSSGSSGGSSSSGGGDAGTGSGTSSSGTDNSGSGSGDTSDGTVSGSSSDGVLSAIIGKVFCMAPGADKRYIAAEDAQGFKVVSDSSGKPVVYYYDGESVIRSTSLVEDDNMVLFTEDADYRVDISLGDKAYLNVLSGQRVNIQSEAFVTRNFTYALAADGEILSVASKTTVNLGEYTYYVQKGTAFDQSRARVVRMSNDGTNEVISSEFGGTVGNIHYDYDSKCMIAEYTDSYNKSGIIKMSIDGDVDLLEDSVSSSSQVELYGIQDGNAVLRRTENGKTVFFTARLDAAVPIAVAVDPRVIVSDSLEAETTPVETGDYDATGTDNNAAVPGQGPGPGPGPGGNSSGVTGVGPGGGYAVIQPGLNGPSMYGPGAMIPTETVGAGPGEN